MAAEERNGSLLVHGKAILAGEHSAVRGHPAIVAPLLSRGLTLQWEESAQFEVESGPIAAPFTLALEKAVGILGRPLPRQKFSIVSDIPLRAGLGSSAALSVAIARFLLPNAPYAELFSLALALEDLFHGKSSGMDVAATLSHEPILFQRGQEPKGLGGWRPPLYLSDTGLRSATKECVAQVSRMERPDLDEKMAAAVAQMRSAFDQRNSSRLASSIEEAAACFTAWDLVPSSVAAQMNALKDQGALAVKPTGSGNGGYLLSFWQEPRDLLPLWV